MKLPLKAPSYFELIDELIENKRYLDIGLSDAPLPEKYLHWDQLRHRQVPEGLSLREWWYLIKSPRISSLKKITLQDKNHIPFSYNVVESISRDLHEIDMHAGGGIQMEDKFLNPQARDQYLVRSLIEEAITSSQLEGAVTTRVVAKELLRSGREPKDKSEKMILNNYMAMRSINKIKNEPLSQELVFELHRIITKDTLEKPEAAGRFRLESEDIEVSDTRDNTTLHVPPNASELPGRMQKMCDFANGKDNLGFIHPAIRSIILHFWLAYDHPFFDGNGRTARALFYWSMLRHGYWLIEFLSISEVIRKSSGQYYKAFLHTETDENDLNYFILYHLKVVNRAIDLLHDYINRRADELRKLESQVKSIAILNHRQRAIIGHALSHPNNMYTINGHKTSHNVTYQTARTDLMGLEELGLFESKKYRRTWVFKALSNLEEKLDQL